MAENITEILGLQTTIFIETIQEGLHNCAYVWSKIGPTTYRTNVLIDGEGWTVVSNKVNNSYYLDVFRNCKLFFSISTLTQPSVKNIYLTLEEQFSSLAEEEEGIIAALNTDCVRTCPPKYYYEVACGGVVVGGQGSPGIIDGCRCCNSDILLVIDTTGSMAGVIRQFADLLVEVLEVMDSPTCRIGLVTYKDYEDGGAYASGWRVDQTFTFDFANVSSLVSSLGVAGGGDGPEQQLSTLKLCADEWVTTLGGRDDSNRVIAWAGDITGHADGAKGFPYPAIESVITSLQDKEIQVVALNGRPSGSGIDGGGQATQITSATSGFVVDNVLSLPLDDVIQQFCDAINVNGCANLCEEGSNIISNGSFDSDLTDWTTTGNASWDSTNFSLNLEKGATAEQIIESLVPDSRLTFDYDWCLTNVSTSMLHQKRILNPGENPETGFPAVCHVGAFVDGTLDYFCSGTLISPRHILTAAHCVDDLLDDEARVDFDGTSYSSIKVYVHPSWSEPDINTDSGNDLAIIELGSDVVGVTPLEISGPEPSIGDPIKIIGFGFFGDDTGYINSPGIKRSGDQQVDEYTSTLLRFYFDVPGESSTAFGDSGGALLYQNSGQWYLTAVVSGGLGSGRLGLGSTLFNTRVSFYNTWITGILGSTPSPPQTIISELRDSSNVPIPLISGSYNRLAESPSCADVGQLAVVAKVPSDGIVKVYFELQGEVIPNTHNLYIDEVILCYEESLDPPPPEPPPEPPPGVIMNGGVVAGGEALVIFRPLVRFL